MPDLDATADVFFLIERPLAWVVLFLLWHAFLVLTVERRVPILLLRGPIERNVCVSKSILRLQSALHPARTRAWEITALTLYS